MNPQPESCPEKQTTKKNHMYHAQKKKKTHKPVSCPGKQKNKKKSN